MQKLVALKREPWYSAFKAMSADLSAAKNYQMRGPVAVVSFRSTGSNQYRFYGDGVAASVQAEMWYITGDNAYRDNALKIIRDWSSTITELSEGIHAPVGLAGMVEAAEILRYTSRSGWTDADTTSFTGMLDIAERTQANGGIDQPGAFMNQASAQIMALMDAAIFQDDRTAYNDFINRITVGVNPDTQRDGAISKQITATGQVQEMGRDQGHASIDVSLPGLMAQTAYIQHMGGALGTDGVDLFPYLDNRILKGAEYFSKYNLGRDVTWDGTGSLYSKISTAGRGVMIEATPIYNHYRFVQHVPDSQMPNLARVQQLQQARNQNWQDILQSTPAGYVGTGPVTPVTSTTPNLAFDRHSSGDGITAISNTDGVSVEPYSDSDGARQIVSNVQNGNWVQYADVDLGSTPSSTLISRVGVSSAAGSKIAVHLDSVTGPTVATVQVPNTGWQTTWTTVVTPLSQQLSGVETLVFEWSGSTNAYRWAGAMNWFKLAPASAQVANAVTDAPEQSGVSAGPGGTGLTFTNGSSVGYDGIDFDNGSTSVAVEANTTAAGTLEFRQGSATGTLVDSIKLPNTGGTWRNVKGLGTGTELLGSQDLTVVYKGTAPAGIKTFRFSYNNPTHAATSADSYLTAITGTVRAARAPDGTGAVSVTAGTTLTYGSIDLSGSYLAIRYAATAPVTLTLHASDRSTDPVLTAKLAKLSPGKWRTQFVKLPDGAGTQFSYVSADAPVTLGSFQSDPDSSAAEVMTAPDDAQYFVGQKITAKFTVTDPYQKTATLRAISLPTGATLDTATNTLVWTPTSAQTGTAHVQLLADNGTETYLSDTAWTVSASADAAIDEAAATVNAADCTTESAKALQYAVTDAKAAVGGRPISYPGQPSTDPNAVPVADVLRYIGLVDTTVKSLRKPYAVNANGAIDVPDHAVVTYDGSTSGTTDASLLPAFDGDLTTYPNGAVHAIAVLDFGVDRTVVDGLRMYPRANEAKRLSGATVQASNDKKTWVTIGTLPVITDNTQIQWFDATMTGTTTQYRYLRFTTIQYFHVNEIEIKAHFVDPTVLTFEKNATALLTAGNYTEASWATLQSALDLAQTVAADPTTRQVELNDATDAVRAAYLDLAVTTHATATS